MLSCFSHQKDLLVVSQKVTPSPLTPASCLLPPPETTGFLGEMIVNVRSAWESTVKDIVPEHRMQGVETFLENLRANQRLCS